MVGQEASGDPSLSYNNGVENTTDISNNGVLVVTKNRPVPAVCRPVLDVGLV